MSRFDQHPWGWTTIAPLACAAHCLAAPVLAIYLPLLASSPALEWGFFGATVLLATVAFGAGVRVHSDLRPLVPIVAGMLLWAASLQGFFAPVSEEVTTMAAALTAAVGMFWNSRLVCGDRPHACEGCRSDLSRAEASRSDELPAATATVRKPLSG